LALLELPDHEDPDAAGAQPETGLPQPFLQVGPPVRRDRAERRLQRREWLRPPHAVPPQGNPPDAPCPPGVSGVSEHPGRTTMCYSETASAWSSVTAASPSSCGHKPSVSCTAVGARSVWLVPPPP